MELINLTPHDIVLDNGVKTKIYSASGEIARVNMKTTINGDVDGFLIYNLEVQGHNIPEPKDGVMYIVSSVVLGQVSRSDLLAPNTNDAKRNDKGHIISVPGFIRN